jgi:DNA-binding MarR family transcriptional regulator
MNQPTGADAEAVVESGLTNTLRRAASAAQAYMQNEVLGTDRLSWTQYRALWILTRQGELRTLTLGSQLGVAKSTAVAVAVGLEHRGLIIRRSPDEDHRQVLLCPTAEGPADHGDRGVDDCLTGEALAQRGGETRQPGDRRGEPFGVRRFETGGAGHQYPVGGHGNGVPHIPVRVQQPVQDPAELRLAVGRRG